MGIDRCCWRPSCTASGIGQRATEPRTGSNWARPPDAAAKTKTGYVKAVDQYTSSIRSSFEAVRRRLEELAEFIAKTLRARSHTLARERGYCPAVDVAGMKILNGGGEMKLRWQRAVNHTALRHRNLTTMSVWDVFPQAGPADLRYVDLLPLMRCANCLSFQRSVDISHWKINEFRRFYERVSAILRCKFDAGQIAKQV